MGLVFPSPEKAIKALFLAFCPIGHYTGKEIIQKKAGKSRNFDKDAQRKWDMRLRTGISLSIERKCLFPYLRYPFRAQEYQPIRKPAISLTVVDTGICGPEVDALTGRKDILTAGDALAGPDRPEMVLRV
jgi:hypothetical protein